MEIFGVYNLDASKLLLKLKEIEIEKYMLWMLKISI